MLNVVILQLCFFTKSFFFPLVEQIKIVEIVRAAKKKSGNPPLERLKNVGQGNLRIQDWI